MGKWWCCRASYPYHERACKHFSKNPVIYEDELPDDLTDLEYSKWYAKSYIIDGVRVGPQRRQMDKDQKEAYYFTDLGAVLQALYDSEININMHWFWDGGIEYGIGDEMNGWKYESRKETIREAIVDIAENACRVYPNSGFAKKYAKAFSGQQD